MGSSGGTFKPERNVMISLFGAECSEWPFSDSTLMHALAFKTQQEKTKQQFYRLECVNRSIELLKTAMRANVPGPMIAQLFQGSGSGIDALSSAGANSSQQPSSNASGGHERNPQDSSLTDSLTESHLESHTSPRTNSAMRRPPSVGSAPLNYSFPPVNGSGVTSMHRRTNSPARIGAAAVATLDEHNHLKEEDKDDLPEAVSLPRSYHMSNRSPLQFHSHRRNFSVPLARPTDLSPQEPPAQFPYRKPHNPMTSVINFGSWQSYDPVPPSTMRRSGSIRKHRKTKSANITPNFGVIDMNVANQVRLPELTESHDFYAPKDKNRVKDENGFDDQQTCSEHSSRESTPIPQVTKGPNFANNLLNS
ncbi:LAME_0G13058g1_1 [Lachancea meyersii CBS 8951]|uniref:LAME_0G13058g1_1 n=1 Tax=Lachancea meyersii CBS 8951 TaxID=1266667 RepID=A0A1G4K9Z8_9SACH|nr:LAME_0G13058g1_1 [Lachancea meyersii CBS 8951]